MNFDKIIKLFTHALKKKLSSNEKIRHEDVNDISSFLKKLRHEKVDTAERVYQFMTSTRLYFKLLNEFSAQFESGSYSHCKTVREALDLFVIVVDNAHIASDIIKKYCKLVDIIVDTESRNINLREYFRVCSYLLTKCVEESVSFKVSVKSYSCSSLSDVMKTTSDVELQALIIEVLLKLQKNNQNVKLSGVFHQVMSLVDQTGTQMNIYQNLRMILHDFNHNSKNIFSINCSNMLLNTKRVREFAGAEETDEIWLDVDLLEKRISFFCDAEFANSFTNFNYYTSSEWEVLTFFAKDIRDISFYYNTSVEQLHISILCDFIGGPNKVHLEIVASRYSDKFLNFVQEVIPKVFSSDFHPDSFKIPMENEEEDDDIEVTSSPIIDHFDAHIKKTKISADCFTDEQQFKIGTLMSSSRVSHNMNVENNEKISALQIQDSKGTSSESLFSENFDRTINDPNKRPSSNKTRKNSVLQNKTNHFETERELNVSANPTVQLISDTSDSDFRENQRMKKRKNKLKRKRTVSYDVGENRENITQKSLSLSADDENGNSKRNNKIASKAKSKNRLVQSDEKHESSKCASNCSFSTSIHFAETPPEKNKKISAMLPDEEPEVNITKRKRKKPCLEVEEKLSDKQTPVYQNLQSPVTKVNVWLRSTKTEKRETACLAVEEKLLDKPPVYQNLESPVAKVNVWLKNTYFDNVMPESERTVVSNAQTDDVFNLDSVSVRANNDVVLIPDMEEHILDDDNIFLKPTLLDAETQLDEFVMKETVHDLDNNSNKIQRNKDVDEIMAIEQINDEGTVNAPTDGVTYANKQNEDVVNLEKKSKSDEIKKINDEIVIHESDDDDSVLQNIEKLFQDKKETNDKPTNGQEKNAESKSKRKLFNPNDLSYLNDSITEQYIRSRENTLDEETVHKGKNKTKKSTKTRGKCTDKKKLDVKKNKAETDMKNDIISFIKNRKSDTTARRSVRQLYNDMVEKCRQHKKETKKKKTPKGKKSKKHYFTSSSSSSMEPLSAALGRSKMTKISNEVNLDETSPPPKTNVAPKINVISDIVIKPAATSHCGCCETAFRTMTKSYLSLICDMEKCNSDLLVNEDCRQIVNILQRCNK